MTNALPLHEETGPGVRHQIIEAAWAHFGRFGYAKTTMSDLAKDIGFSKAYIYKFFSSKQEIGEAICARSSYEQFGAVLLAVEAAAGANEKIRALFRTLVDKNREQYFADRKLYDIVAHSRSENWRSSSAHIAQLNELLGEILRDGRSSGELERKTPLDEVCRGIWVALSPYTDPALLQYNLEDVEAGLSAVLGVVLRSLSP